MNRTARTITQQGNLHFTSDDLSPMEIARRLESVGIYVTEINVFAPIRAGENNEVEF
ncbi:hypothetical protein [Komagataeibacter intermedius]|uniref:hypothetical protein n=1 Tax=Komagataeibacter intermedius TaxID=66229 RepID=UPI003B437713